ncbi:hypothetical protein Tco_1226333 [Tanacetum coccineum]
MCILHLSLTLRVNDEAITFNVGHTLRYSYKYDEESVNRIDVIDVTCEEYAQEVLGFSDSSKNGNPTPSLDPIITNRINACENHDENLKSYQEEFLFALLSPFMGLTDPRIPWTEGRTPI